MGASYLLGLLIVALGARGSRLAWPSTLDGVRRWAAGLVASESRRRALMIVLGLGLLAEYRAELVAVDVTIRSQAGLPAWFGTMPLPAFIDFASDPRLCSAVQVAGWLESLTLLGVYAVLRAAPPPRYAGVGLAIVAAGLAGLSLTAPSASSIDLYLYVGSALAAPNAYAPAALPFPGSDRLLNELWGVPFFASAYGPLWIAISKLAVAAAGHALPARLLAFRILGALALAACVLFMLATKRRPDTIALVAANPALYELYVADGHNDLIGVALILAAFALRRYPALAACALAAAGLVKLPLIVAGALVFWDAPTRMGRWLPPLAAAIAVAGLSWVFGGAAYLHALAGASAHYAKPQPALAHVIHLALAAIALGAVAIALLRRMLPAWAAWSFPSLAQSPLQQYLAWGLPCALIGEAPSIAYLVALPAASFALATFYDDRSPLFVISRALLGIGLIAALAFSLRNRPPRPGELQTLRPTTSS